MFLFEIQPSEGANFHFYAIGTSPERCYLLEFLDGIEANLADNRDDIINLLDWVKSNGPPQNTNLCHKVSKHIWVFIKGSLRIFWFYGDQRRMILCTHGIIKKSQQTKTRDKEFAEQVRKTYFEEIKGGPLTIIAYEDWS